MRFGRRWIRALLAAGALSIGVFVLYVVVYRVRHLSMPLGFDAPWYIWRAEFVSREALGPLGTAARPGHELLAALLGSITGIPQLRMAVLLPLVLAGGFGLVLGAFAWTALGPDLMRWAVAAIVGGTLLGATRLVGENVANLLNLTLVIAALVPLLRFAAGRRGYVGAVLLLVAAGLSHWLFLAVAGAALALAALLALWELPRELGSGTPAVRTGAGAIASIAASAGVVVAALLGGVLPNGFRTFEIREEPSRFRPKLRTDVRRLVPALTLPVTAFGAWALTRPDPIMAANPAKARIRRLGLTIMVGWAVVAVAGLLLSAATLKLPPHRFLSLLVAFPGALALTAAVVWVARRIARRWGRAAAAVAAAAAAVALLAVPGAVAWYRGGPGVWMDPATLRQARAAAAYLTTLAPGQPVVFVVGPFGPAGAVSVPLKERTIRVAVPPVRQASVHVFAGDLSDLLAGRPTRVGPAIDRATLPYWEDVRPVLASNPVVLVLQATGARQYRSAVTEPGAAVIAPGVALVRGPAPAAAIAAGASPTAVPRAVVALAQGILLLGILFLAGGGWARLLLGSDAAPEVVTALAPAAGAGALILGGLLATEAGVRPGGITGALTVIVIAGAGAVLALLDRARTSAG